MSHQVFKLYFYRKDKKGRELDDHIALYVKNGDDGLMFHVIDDDAKSTDTLKYFMFDERDVREDFLNSYQSLRKKEHIGAIPVEKMPSLRSTCRGLPHVIGPQRASKPDCATWFENAVYYLDRKGIVDFRKSFRLPKMAQPLQVKDSSSRSLPSGGSSKKESTSRKEDSRQPKKAGQRGKGSSSRSSSSGGSSGGSSKKESASRGEEKRKSSSRN